MIKGLEELNKIKEINILYDIEMVESGEEYMKENEIDLSIIEKELKVYERFLNVFGLEKLEKTERKLEALDIVRNKLVNSLFVYFMVSCEKAVITPEEYDLLKEVLL